MRELNAEKIRDMTEEEIVTRVRELHEEIFNLRFRNAMRQLQNPVLIRERKRDIARLKTILVEHRTGIRKLAGHGAGLGAVQEPKKAREPKKIEEPKKTEEPRKTREPKKPKEAKKAVESKKAKEPRK